MRAATMPFGRYRGVPLEEVPRAYLRWLLDEVDLREPLLTRVEREYRRRRQRHRRGAAPTLPLALPPALRATAAEIVTTGFRALALKRHPDHGGSHEGMLALQRAREAMERLLGAGWQRTGRRT
jgi:Putative quorum-sensing-regulated virulence factor